MKHDLFAVKPPRGRVVHLFMANYRPGAKERPIADSAGLCGQLLAHDKPQRQMVPLKDALKWTALEPSDDDPRPAWTWCRHCLGHAVDLTGLAAWVLAEVVKR